MKIVFISSMLPSGHYSQYLTAAINEEENVDLIVYTDQDTRNLGIQDCGTIKNLWSKTFRYAYQIIRELKKDQPNIIHLQQEMNMYGGVNTAVIFPLLLLWIQSLGFKSVVTIHASVFKKQIDEEFIVLFHKNANFVRPFFLKIFFHYLFKGISLFSCRIIVHTYLAKNILTSDYGVDSSKVDVIPIGIPQKIHANLPKENYFFYFGYLVRRKGLGFLLDGFKKFIAQKCNRKYQLILAGGVIKGQEEAANEIKEYIKRNGLEDNVLITGYVEEDKLDELYSKALAVVIPAIISFGSSGPLFHAVSYGKCVIASEIGHFIEDIKQNETGLLTKNDKWCEAFQYAIDNPDQIAYIEENVKRVAHKKNCTAITKLHIEKYSEVIGVKLQ
jgi:glycosyltransferase involved in cell wall biosynthesis